jgi:hypothetical protein
VACRASTSCIGKARSRDKDPFEVIQKNRTFRGPLLIFPCHSFHASWAIFMLRK